MNRFRLNVINNSQLIGYLKEVSIMTIKLRYLSIILLITIYQTLWAAQPISLNSADEYRIKSPQTHEKFISLADIHFDPFAACKRAPRPCAMLQKLRAADYKSWNVILASNGMPMSSYGEDTNYPLLQSTLMELKKINTNSNPQFVLILGDFLAHSFREKYNKYSSDTSSESYHQFVNKTLQFLTDQLHQTFPNVNVYPLLGNNDTLTNDYDVVPNGLFLHDAANAWSLLIKDKANRNAFLMTFPQNGYYAVTLPQQQKILMLDTVLFSSHTSNRVMTLAANNQMEWLKQQLALAKKQNRHVILACHIPVGVDIFTSFKLYFLFIKGFWQTSYSAEFQQLMQQYADIVIAILPAHIHMDAFQSIPDTNIPVIFTPSISPIFGNNPGFKEFTYDPHTLSLDNYVTYYLDNTAMISDWRLEYNFNQVYQHDCEPSCSLIHGIRNLSVNNRLALDYQQFFSVGHHSQPITKDHYWQSYYWCGIHNITKVAYKTCLGAADKGADYHNVMRLLKRSVI